MKQKILAIGLIFLVLLSVCVFQGCKDDDDEDKDSNPTGPDLTGWPSDLPTFDYGTLYQMHFKEGTNEFIGATFHSVQNPETAFQEYKKALEAKGWVFEMDASNDVTWAAVYAKDPKGLHFSVSKDGQLGTIMYVED